MSQIIEIVANAGQQSLIPSHIFKIVNTSPLIENSGPTTADSDYNATMPRIPNK